MTDPATATDQLSLLQQLLSAGGGSLLGGGGIMALGLKYLLAQWAKVPPALETLSGRINALETRLAVHDAVSVDSRSVKEELKEHREALIILQQRVNAAWKTLDMKPRTSDG